VTNIQVGNQMFQLSSLATDRFGQVFLGGIEDGIVAGNHRMENYVICVDARGREVVRRPLGPRQPNDRSTVNVTSGPYDHMWLERTGTMNQKSYYEASLISSTTFAVTDICNYNVTSVNQLVTATLSKSRNTAYVSSVIDTLQHQRSELDVSIQSQPLSTHILLPSNDKYPKVQMMWQQILDETTTRIILNYSNDIDPEQNLIAINANAKKAQLTVLRNQPKYTINQCKASVCSGKLERNGETHAALLRLE
jgi:hypothetical protein